MWYGKTTYTPFTRADTDTYTHPAQHAHRELNVNPSMHEQVYALQCDESVR